MRELQDALKYDPASTCIVETIAGRAEMRVADRRAPSRISSRLLSSLPPKSRRGIRSNSAGHRSRIVPAALSPRLSARGPFPHNPRRHRGVFPPCSPCRRGDPSSASGCAGRAACAEQRRNRLRRSARSSDAQSAALHAGFAARSTAIRPRVSPQQPWARAPPQGDARGACRLLRGDSGSIPLMRAPTPTAAIRLPEKGDLDARHRGPRSSTRLDPNAPGHPPRIFGARQCLGAKGGPATRAIADYGEALAARAHSGAAGSTAGSRCGPRASPIWHWRISDQALRLDAKLAPAYNSRWPFWAEPRHSERAIPTMTRLRIDPGLAAALHNRGIALRRGASSIARLADIQSAWALDPNRRGAPPIAGSCSPRATDRYDY